VYEAKKELDQTEACYLNALQIDPNCLSAYSNLALLYETKRELEKALFYWEKRAQLGEADDPWTQMAKNRLQDIRMTLNPKNAIKLKQEQQVIQMLEEISKKKSLLLESNTALSKDYLEKAKRLYQQKRYLEALREALNAQQLDPSDPEIMNLIDKIRIRILSE
ncbi:MAG: hypothetical protein N2Z79_02650, partial [Candidatus Omnitrophica bacterium]|nr:hypothetical protein [Candidatus Omnitrophota bacterium]